MPEASTRTVEVPGAVLYYDVRVADEGADRTLLLIGSPMDASGFGSRGGPVDLFASSGGAVNALALVARHPGQIRTLVAHEPPVATVLPDRESALAAVVDIRRTYQREGFGADFHPEGFAATLRRVLAEPGEP